MDHRTAHESNFDDILWGGWASYLDMHERKNP